MQTAVIPSVSSTVSQVNGPPTAGKKKSPTKFQRSIGSVIPAIQKKVLKPKNFRLNHAGAVSQTSGVFLGSEYYKGLLSASLVTLEDDKVKGCMFLIT